MKILENEINRVNKLASVYRSLGPAGYLELKRLERCLDFAKNALAKCDLSDMNSAYQNLKHIE